MTSIDEPHRATVAGRSNTDVVSLASRHLPAIIAVCLGIVLTMLVFLETRIFFAQEAEIEFQNLAAERSSRLGEALNRDLAILQSLRGFYAGSSRVDRDEFRVFVEHVHPQAVGIRALEWIPRVSAAERADYEENARADGYSDFRISERSSSGDMIAAAVRDEYFPVYFLEPYLGNERALGFDLGSNAARLEALRVARDTGQIAVTASIRLVQETGSQAGFLAFEPIYRTGTTPGTLEGRRSELAGFALGVFGVGDIVSAVLIEESEPEALDTYLYDVSAEPGQRFLHYQPSGFPGAPVEPLPEDQLHEGLVHVEPLFVGDRQWSLVFKPTPGFFSGAGEVEQWGVLCIGLLLTSLLAQHLVSSGNRTAVVQGLVAEKTADLVAANNRLTLEIAGRSRIETELARSNSELEQFASVASHDLQEPLRKVQAFSDRLQQKYAEDLDEKGRDYLSRMGKATARMQTLIDDLLRLSRVTTMGLQFGPTDLKSVIHDVLADLEVRIQEAGAEVIVSAMPVITADPVQMRQLFQNLIGNSLKYGREGVPPIIRVEVETAEADTAERNPVDGPIHRIRVSDNGIGFEQEYAERIFGMFQRLHGRSAYDGAGIGLSICLRIVERHRGCIRAEGRPGAGATITIDLPGKIMQSGVHAK